MTDRPCVVIGCGSPGAGDDAAGLELVERLRRRGVPGCELRTAPAGGFDLIEVLQQAASVIVLDAVSSEARPGTVHVVPLPSGRLHGRNSASLSSHAWGMTEAIDLTRALGGRTPPVVLVGIELAAARPGAPFSPQVARAIEHCETHFDEIRRMALDRFSRARTVVMEQE